VAALEKRQTSITPTLRAELVARYEAGATIRELAAWSGAHRQTVVRHLVRAGIESRNQGLTCEQAKVAAGLYLDGLTLVEIASRLGFRRAPSGDVCVGRAYRCGPLLDAGPCEQIRLTARPQTG
jgi:hypothetical protein